MLRTFAVRVLVSAGLIACGAASLANQPLAEDEIVAAERAALDRWGKGDPGGFLELYAEEVTYFDPFQGRRIEGLEALRALFAPLAGQFSIHRYEMVNPRVQRYGDVAVLTYNLQNYARQADGTERPATRWNSTAVLRRTDGRWRTTHSHWSFAQPQRPNPPQ